MNENKFLKDFFTKKYADSIGDSNFYIAFEDCGFHISKASFTDAITKQYSENVLVEQLSNACDCVIPIDDTVMGHSASTISDCMELLKNTIVFNDKKFGDDSSAMLPVFGDAKNKLAAALVAKASTIDGRTSFYQSNLNPADFLDETNTSLWTPYNESWSFPSTTDSKPAVWKIRPEIFQNLQMARTEALAIPEFKSKAAPDFFSDRKKAMRLSAISAVSATSAVADKPIAKTFLQSRFSNTSIQLQRLFSSNGTVKKEDAPVNTSKVNISFQYCIVNILRPWLYRNIFDISQTWYCLGLPEAFFSTGEQTAANNGKLPSLPVSMILIKELSISATFNAGDWENAKNAVALDSLNIAEADFKDLGDNAHLIESKGVQIIGWICEYLPRLPVCSDPNLTNP